MKLLILVRILITVFLFAFVGAIVGGLSGLVLALLGPLDFHHVPWVMVACAGLFVVLGLPAFDEDEATELPDRADAPEVEVGEPRRPKFVTFCVQPFDDGPFIKTQPIGDMWCE